MSHAQSRLLRTALMSNAAFSALTGVALVLAGAQIATWLGHIPAWLLMTVGGGLMGFAGLIIVAVSHMQPARALLITALDLGWIICTVPLIFVSELLSDPGKVAVLVVAMLVGLLALAQMAGIRALLRDPVAGRGQYRHCVAVEVDAPVQAMWNVIADLGRVAEFSDSLVKSVLRDGVRSGVSAVRVCTNTRGRTWSEVCERFEPETHQFEVRFLTEEPGFPFPVRVMSGGWNVKERVGGKGSVIEVWWSLTPKRLGWLTVALMGMQINSDMTTLIGRMAEVGKGRPLPDVPPKLSASFC